MQKHTKIYLDEMGYDETDFICCEVCGAPAKDIHHIVNRSRGGKDIISNLQALCRSCHIEYGDKKQYMYMLKNIHEKKMKWG